MVWVCAVGRDVVVDFFVLLTVVDVLVFLVVVVVFLVVIFVVVVVAIVVVVVEVVEVSEGRVWFWQEVVQPVKAIGNNNNPQKNEIKRWEDPNIATTSLDY